VVLAPLEKLVHQESRVSQETEVILDSQDHKVALVAKVIEDRKVLLVNLEMLAVLALEVSVASHCLFV